MLAGFVGERSVFQVRRECSVAVADCDPVSLALELCRAVAVVIGLDRVGGFQK